MKSHSPISLPALLFLFSVSVIACGRVSNKIPVDKTSQTENSALNFDTSKTAIIKFNKSNYPFDSTFEAANLKQIELELVDSFILVCVSNYNKSLDKEYKHWSIDLNKHNYRKQLVVAYNRFGQKEIWVNCFCYTFGSDRWKTEIFGVIDGGNCFFHFKINLTTNKHSDLIVNSLG